MGAEMHVPAQDYVVAVNGLVDWYRTSPWASRPSLQEQGNGL